MSTNTQDQLQNQLLRYAETLVKMGVNLQPRQCLRITAELEHAPFVQLVAEEAYRHGAKLVTVDWSYTPLARARMKYSRPEYLEYFPEFEVTKHHQFVDEQWARLGLVGDEFPDLLKDVDPSAMRTVTLTRS